MTENARPPEPSAPRTDGSVSRRLFLFFVLFVFTIFILLTVIFATAENANGLFAFLFLMAALTLVFVGMLGGTGAIEWKWITLGGAPAVYMGLVWLLLQGEEPIVDPKNLMAGFDEQVASEVEDEKVKLSAAHELQLNNLREEHAEALDEVETRHRSQLTEMELRQAARVLWIKFECLGGAEAKTYLSQIHARLDVDWIEKAMEEPTFQTFKRDHMNDEAFNEFLKWGIIRPEEKPGTVILPVPILSSGSEAIIYHNAPEGENPRALMTVDYIDEHPHLTISVYDTTEQMGWCEGAVSTDPFAGQ